MHTTADGIDPNGVYSVRSSARAIKSGTQTIYRAVERRELRAAPINDRGDLRILGSWLLDYLAKRAKPIQEQAIA